MFKCIKYKCLRCQNECDFNDEDEIDKICPKCGETMVFWKNFESDIKLPTKPSKPKPSANSNLPVLDNQKSTSNLTPSVSNNIKETSNSGNILKDIYDELHSINNMMKFFTIIMIISLIGYVLIALSILR